MNEKKRLLGAYELVALNNSVAVLIGVLGAMTFLNIIMIIFGNDTNFIGALEMVTFFHALIFEFMRDGNMAVAATIVLLIAMLAGAGMVLLGVKASELSIGAYKAILVIYLADTLLLLFCSMFIGFLVHAGILFLFYKGYKAAKDLLTMEKTVDELYRIMYGNDDGQGEADVAEENEELEIEGDGMPDIQKGNAYVK